MQPITIPIPVNWLMRQLFRGDPDSIGTLHCIVVDPSVGEELKKVLPPDKFHYEYPSATSVRIIVTRKWKETEEAKNRHTVRRQTRNELREEIFTKISDATKCDFNTANMLTDYLMLTGNEQAALAYNIENFKERWEEALKFNRGGKAP